MPKFMQVAVISALGVLSVSHAYQFSEIKALKQEESLVTQTLTTNQIVSIVDQRLDVAEQRRAKDNFQTLIADYELASPRVPEDRLVYGSLNARLTMQEFSDIECPFCRKMHGGLKSVVDSSEGVVNWEFKHFPLSGHNPAAAMQAKAVECVREAYGNRVAWAAIDQFFEKTRSNGQGVGDLPTFARSMGLSGKVMELCLDSKAHEDRISGDYREGSKLGISGTPALRIFDHKTGRSYLIKGYKTPEQLAQALQQILGP
ncbi:DsbA family protein [Marinobacter adhaerens]|jgi:protein-disulfide isomerase|uniref:DsbA family protein n=1 Tax=Marinobacter adhaerens TaxID=1033846 RepID=UPI001E5858FB|nr:DsbA family protein [Marinobacter adhaerens]MCD1649702.1 DsbA family protein [Marinobacter adhaerens]